MQQRACSIDDTAIRSLCDAIRGVPVRSRSVNTPTKFVSGSLLQLFCIITLQTLKLVVCSSKVHKCTLNRIGGLGFCRICHDFSSANVSDHTHHGLVVEGLLHFLAENDVISDQQFPKLGG